MWKATEHSLLHVAAKRGNLGRWRMRTTWHGIIQGVIHPPQSQVQMMFDTWCRRRVSSVPVEHEGRRVLVLEVHDRKIYLILVGAQLRGRKMGKTSVTGVMAARDAVPRSFAGKRSTMPDLQRRGIIRRLRSQTVTSYGTRKSAPCTGARRPLSLAATLRISVADVKYP
jgi:hypothetical protein